MSDRWAVQVIGHTRAAFILRGAMAAATVSGIGAVGPFVARAVAQAPVAQSGIESDSDILRIALTLELLEANFYDTALKLSLSPAVRTLAEEIGGHEHLHAKKLESVIEQQGGAIADALSTRFHFPMRNEQEFLKLAVVLEEGGVSAYNGAAPSFRSKVNLALAGSIVQIEGRHAAAVRLAAGDVTAPQAFDKPVPLTEATVAAAQYIQTL